MKIAILTQPFGSNYGGILQAYALQCILAELGHETIVLNRLKGYPALLELMYRIGSFLKCLFRRFVQHDRRYVLSNPFKKGDYSVFASVDCDNGRLTEFVRDNIHISDPLYNTVSLRRCVRKLRPDCIIVGSDQVWRQAYSPCITNFFLDFLDGKEFQCIGRYSYAASFGKAQRVMSAENMKKCSALLKYFDGVSVREQSAADYLRDAMGYDSAEVVLDPAMLLPAEEYNKLINENDMCAVGIASYILDCTSEKDYIVSDISGILHKPCTRLPVNRTDDKKNPHCLESVSKWLASIAYSDFVVTDSFHGCVFSIIFKKQFLAIANPERGIDRFDTLLGKFGLKDRLVFTRTDYEKRRKTFFQPINYDGIESVYQALRNESLEFLKNIH